MGKLQSQKNVVSYTQEINRARTTLETILKESTVKNKSSRNKQLIEYIKSIAELKMREQNVFEEEIISYSKEANMRGISGELIRKINISINFSSREFAEETQKTCERILDEYNRRQAKCKKKAVV